MSLRDEPGYDALIWRLVDGGVRLDASPIGDLVLQDETQFVTRARALLGGFNLELTRDEAREAVAVAADDVYRYGPLTSLMNDASVTDITVNALTLSLSTGAGGFSSATFASEAPSTFTPLPFSTWLAWAR